MPDEKESPPKARGNKTVLITAVILAVVAVVVVDLYIRGVEKRQESNRIWALEAARHLDTDQPLKEADVKPVEVSIAIETEADRLVKRDQLAGLLASDHPLIKPAEKGDLLYWSHFTAEGPGAVNNLVPPKFVFETLPLDRRMTAGSLVRPGMYVDLLASFPPVPSRGTPAEPVTLLRRVLVLAVDGRTAADFSAIRSSGSTSVTLQVTPKQAEALYAIVRHLPDGFAVVGRNSEDMTGAGEDRLDDVLKRLGMAAAENAPRGAGAAPPPIGGTPAPAPAAGGGEE